MLAKFRPVWIITRRELRDQFRDWRILFPILALTLIFPVLMNFTARQLVHFVQQYGAGLIGERLLPFLLLIAGFFPISVSLVIALESFVGEKERHSIEPLLNTPLKDWQLYLGKLAASMLLPLFASYLGIGIFVLSIYRQVGWLPPGVLLTQSVALTTVQALVMVSGAVVVSSQTTSVRAANLLASFIVIPMTFLIQGESIVLFWANYSVLWWAIGGQLLIAGLLVRSGIARFNREDLLGRELDSLSLRWAWRTFWKDFRGQAHSPLEWWREVRRAVRQMALPVGIMTVALILGLQAGSSLSRQFTLPAGAFQLQALDSNFIQGLESARFISVGTVPLIWAHNLRVIILATVLGMFSFGVLSMIVLMAPIMLIGYFTGAASAAGIAPLAFLSAFVLPHGVLELPAMVIAGAAILRLGATLAAPMPGQTIGEAWLAALADWAKVMFSLVVPMLLGAAALEVFITPRLALLILGR